MSWEAQKHLYQVAFCHLDKFFQYKISGDFEREGKKKHSKDFSLLLSFIQHGYQISFLGLFCFLFFFNQAATVIAQIAKQAVDEFWIVCRGF